MARSLNPTDPEMRDAVAFLCRWLLEQVGLEDLWDKDGPSARAMALLEANGGKLEGAERILLMVAWVLWSGRGQVLLADVVNDLSSAQLRTVGEALVLCSGGYLAIERWAASRGWRLASDAPPIPEAAMPRVRSLSGILPPPPNELPALPTADQMQAALLESFSLEMPSNLKQLAKLTSVDGLSDIAMDSIQVFAARRRIRGAGVVTVSLEWGGDPAEDTPGSAAFRFTYEAEQRADGKLLVLWKKVDTSRSWEEARPDGPAV
jgi:hypothetical protein